MNIFGTREATELGASALNYSARITSMKNPHLSSLKEITVIHIAQRVFRAGMTIPSELEEDSGFVSSDIGLR